MTLKGIYEVKRCQGHFLQDINHTQMNRENRRTTPEKETSFKLTSHTQHKRGRKRNKMGINRIIKPRNILGIKFNNGGIYIYGNSGYHNVLR